MKIMLRHYAALIGATLFAAAPMAMAQHGPDVNWSLTIGSPVQGPIYSPPPRVVYVEPAPVYVPPRVVHVQPAPVVYYQRYNPSPYYYVDQPRYDRDRHHHHRKHHRHGD